MQILSNERNFVQSAADLLIRVRSCFSLEGSGKGGGTGVQAKKEVGGSSFNEGGKKLSVMQQQHSASRTLLLLILPNFYGLAPFPPFPGFYWAIRKREFRKGATFGNAVFVPGLARLFKCSVLLCGKLLRVLTEKGGEEGV